MDPEPIRRSVFSRTLDEFDDFVCFINIVETSTVQDVTAGTLSIELWMFDELGCITILQI